MTSQTSQSRSASAATEMHKQTQELLSAKISENPNGVLNVDQHESNFNHQQQHDVSCSELQLPAEMYDVIIKQTNRNPTSVKTQREF